MPDPFTVKKNNEYFISVAKKGIHSFMMLGVVDDDGNPKLLARVGKTNDIDPDIDSAVKMTAKAIATSTLARIGDEGVSRRQEYTEQITYSAYSISYDQAKEFLGLIAAVEKKHHENPAIRNAIVSSYVSGLPGEIKGHEDKRAALITEGIAEKNKQIIALDKLIQFKKARLNEPQGDETVKEALRLEAIECYIPVKEQVGRVEFECKVLQEVEFLTADELKASQNADSSSQLTIANTCRTTALNMVEAVLGFATNVSKKFFLSPEYKTTLKAGQPDKATFYILPVPPNVNREQFTPEQFKTLEKIYKRLEQIHKSNPEDPRTRAKFDALKATYNDIAGPNKLSANDLLLKLDEHETSKKTELFEKRGAISKTLGISSSTERLFKSIKKELTNLKEEEELSNGNKIRQK